MIKKRIISILYFLSVATLLAQSDKKYEKWNTEITKGIKFFKDKNFEKAEKPLEEAYIIAQETFSSYNNQYKRNLDYLTKTYWNLKKYEKIAPILEWQIEQIKKIKGDDIKYYHVLLNNLGVVYKLLKKYDKAKINQLAAYQYSLKFEGKQSKNYKQRLNNVFQLFFETKEYKKSIPLNVELLQITKKELGIEHKSYLRYLNNLADSYFDVKDYTNARFAYKQLLHIYKQLENTKSKIYLNSLNFLSICNERIGNYDEGLKNHIEVIELSKEIYGANDEHYLDALVYLGHFYTHFGKYAMAFETYENLTEVIENTIGTENELFALIHHKLGILHFQFNDFYKSQTLLEYSVDLTKTVHGINNYRYINRSSDLALLYSSKGYEKKAIKLYEEVIKLSEINNLMGENYSTILSNLGNIYKNLGDTNKALACYLKAKKYYENNRLPISDILLNNLAGIYDDVKEDSKALELYQKALRISKKKYGENHNQYKTVLANIAWFYEKRKQYDKAKSYIVKANSILIQEIEEVFKFRNNADKKEFLESIFYEFDSNQQFSFLSQYQFDDINELNLNNLITVKGLILNNIKKIVSDLKTLNDDHVSAKIESLKDFKNKANDLLLLLGYGRKKEKRYGDYLEYNQKISDLEKDLIKIYNSNFTNQELFNKNWKDIRANLKPNEVAIEFADFWNTSNEEPDVTYIAYIISSAWEHPKVVTLFNQKEYLSQLKNDAPNQLYATRGAIAKNINFTDLYKLIWKPLETHLKGIETIYYSPYGLLNKVSFAAIINPKNIRLIDTYNLIQLTSTSSLSKGLSEPKIKDVALIGGADFESNISNGKFVNFNRGFNEESDYNWNYLKGTKEEILKIQEKLDKKNMDTELFLADKAREEVLKRMDAKSPSLLHIATHGFYFPKKDNNIGNNKYIPYAGHANNKEPLLRTGLVLTGANQVWRYNRVPKNVDDGTLSGLEISNLDLSTTNVVVLSACETGLGDIDGSEGVYGLQRAFKMAGVDIIIMSLWQVPDTETNEFMNLFYSNWLGGMKIREAFKNTQKTMANKYRETPEKWAAFVLIE